MSTSPAITKFFHLNSQPLIWSLSSNNALFFSGFVLSRFYMFWIAVPGSTPIPACPGSVWGLPRSSPAWPRCHSWSSTCTRGQSPCSVGCPGYLWSNLWVLHTKQGSNNISFTLYILCIYLGSCTIYGWKNMIFVPQWSYFKHKR